MRENAEAVFAACDAAHGRWAKLLGVRAALHPKLRLQEFLIIYNITEEFIAATEKVFPLLFAKRALIHPYSLHFMMLSQPHLRVDWRPFGLQHSWNPTATIEAVC